MICAYTCMSIIQQSTTFCIIFISTKLNKNNIVKKRNIIISHLKSHNQKLSYNHFV